MSIFEEDDSHMSLITFPDGKNSEQLDYFLDYNHSLSNKSIEYSIKNSIYYSDHYPIMINIIDNK